MYRLTLEFSDYGTEPVSLEEAKNHLRVSNDLEDTLIGEIISSAREWCENYCNRSFIEKTVELYISQANDTYEFDITHGPILSIDEVYSIDKSGTETLLTLNGDYYLYGSKYKTIEFTQSASENISYKIVYTTQDDCPDSVKQAILKLVNEMWVNRGLIEEQGGFTGSELKTFNVRQILNGFKNRVWI